MKIQRRRAKPKLNVEPISVWQALNQPIVEVTGEAARAIFLATAIILLAAWLAPYWGTEQYQAAVAGAQIEVVSQHEWYSITSTIPADVAQAFTEAANEVLDVSEPASQIAEFYEPGAEAVWNAWLDLMADPY